MGRIHLGAAAAEAQDAELAVQVRGSLLEATGGEASRFARSVAPRSSGAFVLELPRAGRYCVWAEQRLPDGGRRFSELLPQFAPGQPLRLELEEQVRRAKRVRVVGADAWQHRGPLRVRARIDAAHVPPLELSTHPGGGWVLPPLPGESLYLEVSDSAGRRILDRQTSVWQSAKSDVNFQLPAPQKMRVRVYDSTSREPIAGASVVYRCTRGGDRLRFTFEGDDEAVSYGVGGRSDAEGVLQVELPWAIRSLTTAWMNTLIVRAPGFSPQWVQLVNSQAGFVDKHAREGSVLPDVDVFLEASTKLEGRVQDAEGKGIEGLLLAYQEHGIYMRQGGHTMSQELGIRTLRTGAEGRFEIDELVSEKSLRLFALPADPQRQRLFAPFQEKLAGYHVARPVLLWSGRVPTAQEQPKLEVAVSPEDLGAFRIEISRPDGRPARDVRVRYAAFTKDHCTTFTNRRGRLAIVGASPNMHVLAVEPAQGWCYVSLRQAKREDPWAPVAMLLRDWNHVRGRVVDPAGKPVAGATIRDTSSSWSHSVPRIFYVQNAEMMEATSDAQGRFEIRFIAKRGVGFGILAEHGKGAARTTSAKLRVQDRDLEDVVLELQK